MGRLHVASGALISAALLSGCAASVENGASYTAPTAEGARVVSLGSGASVTSVSQRLSSLGLTVTEQGANYVVAEGDGAKSDLVSCGTIRQRAFGNSSVIDGDAPRAAIYTSLEPPSLMVRETTVASLVRIELADRQATVQENHDITIKWTTGSGRVIGPNSASLSLGEITEFADETRCATTGLVSRSLR